MTHDIMASSITRYTSEIKQKLFSHLQNFYTRKTHWLIPFPWKPNFRFLFEQSYMKDIYFNQCMDHDYGDSRFSLETTDHNFTFDLLEICNQIGVRLVTIEGALGSGKSAIVSKLLRDWIKHPFDGSDMLVLHADFTKNCINIENFDLNAVLAIFNIPDYLYEDFLSLIENNGEEILVVIETNDLSQSSRLIFKLFYKVFPLSKFLIFHRPDFADTFKDIPPSQEYFYLLRKRMKLRLRQFEAKQTMKFLKQVCFNSIVFQNFCDALHEHRDLKRLCTNPFLCMVILQLYKETKGMKFIENKLLFFRKILLAMWKRYSNTKGTKSETDIINHIDSLLITLSENAVQIFSSVNPYQFTDDILSNNEHTALLLDSGLLIEHRTEVYGNEEATEHSYSFFDPMLHEYACALYFSKFITEQYHTNDVTDIRNTLLTAEWSNVCLFVAGLLGKRFGLLLRGMDFEYIEDASLSIFTNALYQCQCPKICLQDVKKGQLPTSIDFSELPISSSTLKGFQVLIDWENETTEDDRLHQNKRNSINLNYQKLALEKIAMQQSRNDLNDSRLYYKQNKNTRQKYSSCPNLNRTFSTLSLKVDLEKLGSDFDDTEQQSWSSHFQAHINKQKSLANLSLLGANRITKTNHIQLSPTKTGFYSFPPRQDWSIDQLSLLGRTESSMSLFSSMESLLAVSENKCLTIKEFRIKGSCIGNRTFASLISLLRSNPIDRLFLMDQDESENTNQYFLSSKLVVKFMEVVQNTVELSLNSNILGSNWIDCLVDLVLHNGNIKYLSLAVLDLKDINVENALKLIKAFHRNTTIKQFELFCGVQSIVVQTSLGFFVDILERDDRITVIFL